MPTPKTPSVMVIVYIIYCFYLFSIMVVCWSLPSSKSSHSVCITHSMVKVVGSRRARSLAVFFKPWFKISKKIKKVKKNKEVVNNWLQFGIIIRCMGCRAVYFVRCVFFISVIILKSWKLIWDSLLMDLIQLNLS